MKQFISDFNKLVKLRLTLTVVFSASISFLIGAKQQGDIIWLNWLILTVGGFFVTGAANGFNEIIERDLDRLMKRTADRPLPAGRMTTGQALVMSLFMGIFGTLFLVQLNFLAGLLSVFSIILYAFVYTPLKQKSPIAVFVGAFPGALPPLIGYYAAFKSAGFGFEYAAVSEAAIVITPWVLFLIQFFWQFPHFWAIAWVADEDYKNAGFRLLPTTKKDRLSAWLIFVSGVLMIPVGFLPMYYGFGGWVFTVASVLGGLLFAVYGYQHARQMTDATAKKVMFTSFIYLPLTQLILLFDFIPLK
ncbi:protoheme IX farnesyltransferase [Sphingobacterium allocomposti]|uniref:Protoheme IX farnesyltransferase n=1 Tax=Sphingobacterium allocomposti TaxID=415956 RepID=A0A5S5DU50_9SPHI|nr:heme o synthase [Sphingobacterium composti Yoo et al. 2007 non Ten et al. 2007]TYP98536.1 protoheme IX farnesyltransferase [Sphingobacterium composti Yoo et al. 2007 non Ten et al. 2007]